MLTCHNQQAINSPWLVSCGDSRMEPRSNFDCRIRCRNINPQSGLNGQPATASHSFMYHFISPVTSDSPKTILHNTVHIHIISSRTDQNRVESCIDHPTAPDLHSGKRQGTAECSGLRFPCHARSSDMAPAPAPAKLEAGRYGPW